IRDRTVTGVQTCALPISSGNDDAGPVEHVRDQLDVENLQRPRRWNDVAPSAAGILTHRPSEVAFERFGAVASEERSDRLRRPLRSEEHTSELQSPYDLVC